MELIIISDSQIKLMLTPDDMAAYRNTDGNKAILRGILHDVREKCGYQGISGRVFIQMYPSREGGCELFVTKLKERNEKTATGSGEDSVLTEYCKYLFKDRGSHIIYSFESLKYLLGTCLGLMQMQYSGESSAFIDRSKKRYYLILDCETHIAGEHFGSLCPSSAYYYINEHCDLICDAAVEKLGVLA